MAVLLRKRVYAGLALACVGALCLITAVVLADGELTEEELQQVYMDYLTKEGYRPEIDEDGDVIFKREGKLYFIDVAADDQGYFALILPSIWPIESEGERLQVLAAADHANSLSKVAKVYTINDNVWVAVEAFVTSPDQFKGIFSRSLFALDVGVNAFVSKMQEYMAQ